MPFVLPSGARPVSIEHPSAARSGPGDERNRIGRHGCGSKEDTVLNSSRVSGGTRWAAALSVAVVGLGFAAQASPARPRATATLRLTKHVVAQPGVADPGRFD